MPENTFMSVEEDNVALLKQAYAQWASHKGQDCGCWMSLIADEATLYSLGNGAPEMAFTESRVGRAGILGYIEGLTRDWEMLSYDMDDYIAQGDRVVAIGRVAWRNKATGKVSDTPKIDVWRFRDGQAVSFAEYYDTANVLAAATP
jgi:ketosteroid isomerase-like protein